MLIGLLGEQPILEDNVKDFDEMIEVVGLFEIGIRAEPISFGDVLIQARTAQHNSAETGVFGLVPQPVEDFQTGHPGHFEVENQQIWERKLVSLGKLALTLEILDDFHSVSDFKNLDGLLIPPQGQLKQAAIVGIVFGQEDCKIDIHILRQSKEGGGRWTVGGSPRERIWRTQSWRLSRDVPSRAASAKNVRQDGWAFTPYALWVRSEKL